MANASGDGKKTACVMIGDVSYDFSAEIMKGYFSAAAREKLRLLMLMGMPRHAAHFESGDEAGSTYQYNSIYEYAGLSGADAYVFSCGALSGFESKNTYEEFIQHFERMPYVILQDTVDTATKMASCITIDNYSSFSQGIEHLIEVHGFAKIAFVGGLPEHPDTKERLTAYRETMRKYDLPVEDSMIVFGDFSEYSDSRVAQLLDRHPDIQAIAFCNDEMAKGGYRECRRRGLQVGEDIAITGFDNFAASRSLVPPLTTISQNAYQMGEMAIGQAAAMLRGETGQCIKLQTEFHIRQSCGCHPDTVQKLFDCGGAADAQAMADGSPAQAALIGRIQSDLMDGFPASEQQKAAAMAGELAEQLSKAAEGDPMRLFDRTALQRWLRKYCTAYPDAVSILAKRFTDYIMQVPHECLANPYIRKLYEIMSFTQGYLYSAKAWSAERSLDEFRAQSWFIPELIRDLVNYDIENESVLLSVVERMQGLQINSVYICLLPKPRSLQNSTGHVNMPKKLLLAAYRNGDKLRAYPRSQMPVIDAKHSLQELPDLGGETHLMCFSIFSGDVQYGMMMCEVDIPKTPLMHILGLQLGILINFLDLKQKEEIVYSELENIRERNEILNFLNEYDSQCGILNRRGFIERAIRLNRDNAGRHAICVFMDLDHLKEINDTFGHSQGDVALSAVSDILKKTVRGNDLVARIGGDEFVGMFLIDSPQYDQRFRERLAEAFETYNASSGLPYFVEASVGIAHFTCNQGLEISKIVNDADRYLYEAKKSKRRSALKDQN